jgi:two-component system, LytTR family, response regulator
MLSVIQTNFLMLPTCKGIEVIDKETIIRVEAVSNYSKLFFKSGKVLVVAKVLSRIESQLSSPQFIRIHRTHLINKQFIQRYRNGEKACVELLNGELIDVSKSKKAAFLKNLYR